RRRGGRSALGDGEVHRERGGQDGPARHHRLVPQAVLHGAQAADRRALDAAARPRRARARGRRRAAGSGVRVPGTPVALDVDRRGLLADPAQHHLRADPWAAQGTALEDTVDFQLSEDQEALRAGIRSFCAGRVSIDALRELEKQGFDRALWGELAEMGVFSLRQSEAAGGVGLGSADAVIVFAELGRRLVPGPLAWTHLAADLVKGAAAGEAVVGGIEQLRPSNDPVLVEHLDQLDALIVLRGDGVYRVDPKRISARAAGTPLDPFTPIFHV